MPTSFQCIITTPEEQLLDEQVGYVSLPAWDGQLGVQHLHAPLLVKLGYGPLTLTAEDGSKKSFFVGGGFAQVKDNILDVLTDEALPPERINRAEAEAALAEAQASKATGPNAIQRRQNDLSRARAMIAMG